MVVAVTGTSVLGMFSGPAAHAAVTTSYSLQTASVTAPHGYKFSMHVLSGSLSITFTRTATTGHHPSQSHTWSFTISQGAFSCTSTLSSCTLDTGTSMGTAAGRAPNYGNIKMTFHPNHIAKTVQNKCPNGTVTGSTTTRTGNLTGTFHFLSNTAFFGAINKTSLATTATKQVSNGKVCPGGSSRCFPGLSMNASHFASDFALTSFNAGRPLPTGTAFMFFSFSESSTRTAPANVSHFIGVFGLPSTDVKATSTLTKITANSTGAGMITGTETITRQGSLTTNTVHRCKTQSSTADPVSGNLTAHFDVVGSKTLAGADGNFSKTTKVT